MSRDAADTSGSEGLSLRIKGIVQGVGFRPFIYLHALKWHLRGFVLNDSEGVLLEVEGSPGDVSGFVKELPGAAPPFSRISAIIEERIPPRGYGDFQIRESGQGRERFVLIPPDLATCIDCGRELLDPSDFRHQYPFINCTNCGPRFTIIRDIPYDRAKTSMSAFPMCPVCQREFDDPLSRRFHAQPNACGACGPQLSIIDNQGAAVQADDPVSRVTGLLRDGKIIAIKGLGGFHLACDAKNEAAVQNLRQRKYREDKPFALMAGDLETIRKYCGVNDLEEKLIESEKRPIVLLKKLGSGEPGSGELAPGIAPVQDTLGFMLPYTPLHYLIFREPGLVLVMTSGNVSDEPICFDNEEAFSRLKGIADYFLLHNREIHIRCDDSVTRVAGGHEMILRRSRGYVPSPLELPWTFKSPVLACGAELKSTFCLTRENMAFISHHIGDLENAETLLSYEQGIGHFKRLFFIEPEVVAYDIHPEYLSTKYALSCSNAKKIGIQHHHAHLASCLADNGTNEKAIGVIFDGLGAGPDGTLWGGEFLLGDFRDFERVAYFRPVPLPGGTRAIKEPWRMAIAWLYRIFGDAFWDLQIPFVRDLEKRSWPLFRKMLDSGLGSPLTSSAGRLFDAASALMGLRGSINYEGQAAIELEMAATDSTGECYGFDVEDRGSSSILDLSPTFSGIVEDLQSKLSRAVIARKFHNTMASVVDETCRKIGSKNGNSRVVLSGGVFQNILLLETCREKLLRSGFQVLTHERVPPNDGGICLGQAVIADMRC